MKHYVMIDAHSGYVWEEADANDPIEACRIIDRKIGAEADEYAEQRLDGQSGYYVYEAPADWTPVEDGQSKTEIERVLALPLVAQIATTRRGDIY